VKWKAPADFAGVKFDRIAEKRGKGERRKKEKDV
jgi:hypothetical protein